MSDALYIVWRNEQDQYVRLLNLDEAGVIFKARDSWKPTIAGRQPVTVQAEHRRGASTMVAERRDTGSVGGTFMVKGATADEALTRVESLLAQADSAGRDRWLWWLPQGATYPSLFPLLGPGSASVNWTFPMFLSGFVPVDVSWPSQSWTEEPVMDFSDDFRVRDVGAAGVVLTGLQQFAQDYTTTVVPTSVAQGVVELPIQNLTSTAKVAHLGRRPWRDGCVTVKGKAKTGAGASSFAVTPGCRYTPADGKYFFASLDGGNLVVREWDGAALQSRASVAQAAPAVGTNHWLRIRAEGTSVTAEYWTTLPTPHGTPTQTITYANAATLRTGYPLVTSYGMTSGAANISIIAQVDSRPYSYRLQNTPALVTLTDLPGTAPAAVDIDLTAPTTDSDYARHLLLGWRRAKAGEFVGSVGATLHTSMLVPGETGFAVTGTAVTAADAAKYRGGASTAMGYTTAATAGSANALWYVDPSAFVEDDFARSVTFAVFVRYWRDTTIIAPRLQGALFTVAETTLAGRPLPEFGSTGRYLPTQGAAGVRTTFLGTVTVERLGVLGLNVTLSWSAGSAAAVAFAIDELYFVPLASLAVSATGKYRDDGTYTSAMAPLTRELTRRVRSDLSGALIGPAAGSTAESLALVPAPYPLNMGGTPILMPTDSEGVELLVRPSVSVPDDPTGTATDILTHNVTVHARVTPRHHLLSA